MKKVTQALLCGILVLGLNSCGYDGGYRYPCQDPANWQKAECKPPICTASGSCPADVNTNIKETTTNG
jgi:hypothetical protein